MRPFVLLSALVVSFVGHPVLPAAPSPIQATPATTVTLNGVAMDRTRAPIPGAHVAVAAEGQSTPISTAADANGAFTLTLVPAGRHHGLCKRFPRPDGAPGRHDIGGDPA